MSFGSWLEEGWHWIEEKGAEVIHAIEPVAEGVLELVYKVADELKRIAIDSWQALARAMNVVLDDLKWAWDTTVAFFGAVFNWREIRDRTFEINDQLTKVVKYGEFVLNATIDELINFVRLYVKALENDVDKELDRLAGIPNPAIDNINKPDDSSHDYRKSAKMSIFSTALDKGLPEQKKDPNASSSDPQVPMDKLQAAADAIAIGPDPLQRLKDLTHAVSDAMTVPVKLANVVAILKDLFKLAIEVVESGIELILGLFKDVIHALVEVLTESIEIPIITPLLRWCAGTDSGFDLPSPIAIVSFIMAVASVELEAFHILDAPKKKRSYDLVSTFEDEDSLRSDIKTWFSNHAPASNTPVVTMQMTSAPGDSSQPDSPSTEPEESQEYTFVSSIGHPCILAVHFVLSSLNAATTGIRVLASQGKSLNEIDKREKLDKRIGILEKLDFAAAIVDIAFTCPPRMGRPHLDAMTGAYCISSISSGLALVGSIVIPQLPAKQEETKLGFAIFQFLLGMGKTTASSVAQYAQTQPIDENDPNHSGWAIPDQQDIDTLNLTTGNIVCSAVASLAELTTAVGEFCMKQGEETADIPEVVAGAFLLIGGSAVDVLVAVPDLVVDSIKSNRENQALSNVGAYTSSSRR